MVNVDINGTELLEFVSFMFIIFTLFDMKLVTSEIFNKLRVFKSMLGSVPPASI